MAGQNPEMERPGRRINPAGFNIGLSGISVVLSDLIEVIF
jgi:hypothetical protein